MKKALLYEKTGKDNTVNCFLCAHRCRIKEGHSGVCRVRMNKDGELYSLNYDKVCTTHLDPIEKKPLYHFLPGSTSYSVATMGCNFKCEFCQNYSLSMVENETRILGQHIPPGELVEEALESGAKSISYTYSEPTIFFELMLETAKLAKEKGLKNVMVTNGYMTAEALEMLAPYLDAANIDLKAFTENFYKKYCSARLAPVLETIKGMRAKNIWVEVTTLLIPGLNTDKQEIKELIAFINEVDNQMPWHVSRFFPQYHLMNASVTPSEIIYDALEMGHNMGLKYVYAGNVADDQFANTTCPKCSAILIERIGYSTGVKKLADGKCQSCGHEIAGVW
ncbi:MAG: AmmeMemoRadiSam system radical SAM enzyme [Acidobacteria bacterium]|jgi:pyruvate formate lyase activating enzyme|nr:AmmeMemoRadiSam system radical SAM enzyme [Acidobacteriota bacterium]